MFVITESINQYDQEGDYLVTVFAKKPTLEQLMSPELFGDDKLLAEHVLNGGGRRETEYNWYYLTELKEGELYKSYNS